VGEREGKKALPKGERGRGEGERSLLRGKGKSIVLNHGKKRGEGKHDVLWKKREKGKGKECLLAQERKERREEGKKTKKGRNLFLQGPFSAGESTVGALNSSLKRKEQLSLTGKKKNSFFNFERQGKKEGRL